MIGDNDEFGRSQLLGAFIPILLPVVVVLLPLLDFGLAVVRRMSAGKSPFSPDRKHLHHRMLDMGHSDRDAVLIFYAWTAIVEPRVPADVHRHAVRVAGRLPGSASPSASSASPPAWSSRSCPRAAAPPAPAAPSPTWRPPHEPDSRPSSVILRTDPRVVRASVTGVLAVVGGVIGYLVAGPTGLWSALVGVLARRPSSSG